MVSNLQAGNQRRGEHVDPFRDFGLPVPQDLSSDDLDVAHLIDAVVTSLDVGFRKPHPAMFEAGLQLACCAAGECSIIGDSEVKDIQPAVGLGMRAIRVAIEAPRPASSAAHAVVTTLPQAGSIVTEWASAAAV